ncbi:MAG: GNAT family N-acetyltransferase [Pseudobdellovibrionaceae bacterium]
MTDETFEEFKKISWAEYGSNFSEVENIPGEIGIKNAMEQFARLVPNGLDSDGQYFFDVVEDQSGEMIGFLWLGLQTRFGRAVLSINDISIVESRRGQGFGKALMKCVELEANKYGAKRIRLHVFQHNEAARKLYSSMGFQVSSVDMFKLI